MPTFFVSICTWIVSSLAFAAPAPLLEIRELVQALGHEPWTRTYEGFAIWDRVVGRPPIGKPPLEMFLSQLDSPRNIRALGELEARLKRVDAEVRGGTPLAKATALELAQDPMVTPGGLLFSPVQKSTSSAAKAYARVRSAFLQAHTKCAVQLVIREGYQPFLPSVLVRLEALGFKIDPTFKSGPRLMVKGIAPEKVLRDLSGVDGIEIVHALATKQRPPIVFSRGMIEFF